MIINPYRFAAGATPPAPLHWWDLTDTKADGLWDFGSGEFGLLTTSSAGVTVEADQPDGAGDCIEFDNSGAIDGYVYALQDKSWDGAGNDISISCWIAFPTGSTFIGKPFFSWYNTTPDDRLVVLNVAAATEAWLATFYDTGTNEVEALDQFEDPVADGRWYHVVATYNGTTDTASLYVDNTFIDSTTNASMGALEDQPMPLAIGARADLPTTTGIDARMFSLSIYDKVLDADERSTLYNGGNGGTYADYFGATAIGTNPTTTDLFAWWKLEDVNDAHGSNTLTNNGTTTFTAGYNDNAATFNGSSQYLSVAANGVFPTGAQTWACWIKVGTVGATQDCMTWWGASGQRTMTLLQLSAGEIVVAVTGDGSTVINAQSTLTVPAGTWVHVAAVYVPSTSLTLYINGTQADQDTTSVPSALHDSTTDFAIGARAVPSNYFDGQVDDACIFSKALSADEVQWLVHNTYADLT